MADPYAGSGWKSWSGGSMATYQYKVPKIAAKTSHGHSLFGNLLRDIVNTPKGIAMGSIALAEHPIRTVKEMGIQTEKFYAPLFTGHMGQFYKNVHEHPLQPILDAISIATLGAGGAGLGIKAADVMANGRLLTRLGAAGAGEEGLGASTATWEKMVAESSHPGIAKARAMTSRGSPYTREALPNHGTGIDVYRQFSHNLFTRAMQKYAFDRPASTLAKVPVASKLIGEGGSVYDLSPSGRGMRALKLKASERRGAYHQTVAHEQGFIKKVYYKTKGLPKAEKEAARGMAMGKLVAAVDKGAEATFVKIHPSMAPEVMPSEAPFKYVEDQSRIKGPKGPVTYLPKEGAGSGKTVLHLPDGSTKVVKGGIKKAGSKRAIHLPDSALQTMQRETSGKAFVGIDWEDPAARKAIGETLAARFKGTSNRGAAARDAQGNFLAQRHDLAEVATEEARNAQKTVSLLARKPITAWKYMVLSLSPRYFVNNLTNYLMFGMAQNPVGTTRGVIDAIRQSRGHFAADASKTEMENFLDKNIMKFTGGENGWFQEQYGGIFSTSYGHGVESGAFKKGFGVGFTAVEKGIYAPSMRAGTMAALRALPQVRALEKMYRENGMNPVEAFNAAAARASADPAIHDLVVKTVGNWAGQYYHLSSLEQKITAIVPFYNWDRHALRFARTLVVHQTPVASAISRIGVQGNQLQEKDLGKLPDFMRTAIPIGQLGGVAGKVEDAILGSQQVGRQKILLTSGQNPLAAAGEVVHAGAGLFGAYQGGESSAAQLSPLISGLLEGVTGQNPISGAKVKPGFMGYGGIAGTTLNALVSTPAPVKVVSHAAHALLSGGDFGYPSPKPSKVTGKTKPFLYQKKQSTTVRNWLGLDVKDYNATAASALYDKEHNVKKPPAFKFLKASIPKSMFDGKHHGTSGGTSGFVVKRRKTSTRRVTGHTKLSFPRARKKGLKGISGIGGI